MKLLRKVAIASSTTSPWTMKTWSSTRMQASGAVICRGIADLRTPREPSAERVPVPSAPAEQLPIVQPRECHLKDIVPTVVEAQSIAFLQSSGDRSVVLGVTNSTASEAADGFLQSRRLQQEVVIVVQAVGRRIADRVSPSGFEMIRCARRIRALERTRLIDFDNSRRNGPILYIAMTTPYTVELERSSRTPALVPLDHPSALYPACWMTILTVAETVPYFSDGVLLTAS